MKIALAQLNFCIADFEGNLRKMKQAVSDAKKQKAELIVFPELAVCGYPPQDLLDSEHFIKQCHLYIETLAACSTNIAIIAGSPSLNYNSNGKRLYNTAYLLADGVVKTGYHKGLLPDYDVFDEYRYFEPGRIFDVFEYKHVKIALTICEDLWAADEPSLYTLCPMDELIKQQPDVIINIAASPFSYDHAEARKEILVKNAARYNLPVMYVNHVGAQTELIFDGGSTVVLPGGQVYDELHYFEEDIRTYDLNDLKKEHTANYTTHPQISKTARIYSALVLGIKDYFLKLGFKKAVLGLSGGIDSALVTALAVQALGKENVKVLLMPSAYSSTHSVDDSLNLIKNTGVSHEIIPITNLCSSFEKSLCTIFDKLPPDVTEENIQARIRAVLLMAVANKFGYVLLNTSNKSELAVGYGTLYGDMGGGLSVIGDLYKTEVYELSAYMNNTQEIIPKNILSKEPSAELRPDQKDTDTLPPYALLDKILYQYIDMNRDESQIVAHGVDAQLVKRVIRMVNTSEHKRHQSPPILRISNKAFGSGRKRPIVAKY